MCIFYLVVLEVRIEDAGARKALAGMQVRFFFSLKFHEVVELNSYFFLRSHDEQVPVLDEARGGFPARQADWSRIFDQLSRT